MVGGPAGARVRVCVCVCAPISKSVNRSLPSWRPAISFYPVTIVNRFFLSRGQQQLAWPATLPIRIVRLERDSVLLRSTLSCYIHARTQLYVYLYVNGLAFNRHFSFRSPVLGKVYIYRATRPFPRFIWKVEMRKLWESGVEILCTCHTDPGGLIHAWRKVKGAAWNLFSFASKCLSIITFRRQVHMACQYLLTCLN